MRNEKQIAEYWQKFLRATGRDPETRYFECFHFELTEQAANELLDLVLRGVKRATASSLLYYQTRNEPMPVVGDLSIVTDWEGTPKCVIMTVAVTVLPFKDVTFDICSREGEDDTLESWQRGHTSFFTRDGEREGYTFSLDMPVVFEDFEVVWG